MAGKQDTLIYIEQENKTEAEFMSRSFVNSAIKNRAYINALGAELVMKYLASEGIDISDTHNLHSISKILEKIDISDILLPNIHIDVRVIFDENQIFIPKTHFQLEITPDIYVVLKLAKDFSHVEFLGYFEPDSLNLKLCNNDYYFFEKERLHAPSTLKQFIKNFTGNTSRGISQDDILRGRELSIAMADHNISDSEQKELIELLLLSNELRESVLEFDNFETLSYSVGSTLSPNKTDMTKSAAIVLDTEHDTPEQNNEHQNNQEEQKDSSEENIENLAVDTPEEINFSNAQDDLVLDESFFELTEPETAENLSGDKADTEQTEAEAENILDSEPEISNITNISDIQNPQEETLLEDEDLITTEENIEPLEELELNSEDLTLPEAETLQLDEDIPQEENTLEKTVGDAVQKALKKSEEISTPANDDNIEQGASKDAIKLAGVSGDIVNELINKNIESQQEELNKIDYSQISTNAAEVPEHIAAYDLSAAKIEMDAQAEASGQFDTPKDLSEFKTVETKQTIGEEENFVPETIDLESMESIETEDFNESTESIVDLEHLSTIDSPTKPIEDLEEKLLNNNSDKHLSDMNFSNMSSFTINEDGSSPIDDIDINFNNDNDEHLVDFGPAANTLIIDDTPQQYSPSIDESIEADLMLEDSFSTDEIFEPETQPEETSLLDDTPQETSNAIGETPVMEEFSLDENFEDTMSLDDSNILLDENLSGEELDLVTETTIEELTPSLENDESLNIQQTESLAEPVFEEPLPENDIIINETIEPNNKADIESIEFSTAAIDTGDEISPDMLLDNVISNLEKDNNITSNETTTEEFQPTIEETTELPDSTILEETNFEPIQLPDEISTTETNQETDTIKNNSLELDNQDWLNDTNYDNIPDAEIPAPADVETIEPDNILEELSPEEFITEPEPNNTKVFAVTENSIAISDMNFKPGEIPIDINNNEQPQLDGPEQLESIYDEDNSVPGSALLLNPGRLGSANRGGAKIGMGMGLGIIGVVLAIAIVGIIGFSVSKMLNKPADDTPQPITDEPIPTNSDNGVADVNTLNVNPDNVVNMDSTNNTPALPAAKPAKQKPTVTSQQPTTVQQPVQQKKVMSATSFLEINKLTWEVPDYISYNEQFKQYFQAAGKSLKLSLNSDLLLATDYAYSDQVRVTITFAKDGTFKDAKILLSSGSNQIDNIVLQTVNQTLRVLKAPHSVGNDESTTVILKIYF